MTEAPCWHQAAQITCTCNTGPGRPQEQACPSEAAYRREIRAGGHVHQHCRQAATVAAAGRAARWPPAAEDPIDLWPCTCPAELGTLEETLTYRHDYRWAGNRWEHA